jgi:ubiquitin thioesterase protein OTUB1
LTQKTLSVNYPTFRRIRGDGNCFYRASIFGFLEYLVLSKNTKIMDEFETILKDTTQFKKLGFDEFIFEEFQSVLLDVLKGLEK